MEGKAVPVWATAALSLSRGRHHTASGRTRHKATSPLDRLARGSACHVCGDDALSGRRAGGQGPLPPALPRAGIVVVVIVPALHLVHRDDGQRGDPFMLVVEARDVAELLATGAEKCGA